MCSQCLGVTVISGREITVCSQCLGLTVISD